MRPTCGSALRKLFEGLNDAVLTSEQVCQLLEASPDARPWPRDTVLDRLKKYSVNHPDKKWLKNMDSRSFLFWLEEDRFRKRNPADGHWIRVDGEMVQVPGEGNELDEDQEADEFAVIESPVSLSIERDLQECLAQNVALIEEGLKLYTVDGMKGVEFHAGDAGRIDLLAIDKEGGFVVIELKAGEAGGDAYTQLCRYMGWVEVNLANGKPVRGILVASKFHVHCRYAMKAAPRVQLKKYEMHFNFSDGLGG